MLPWLWQTFQQPSSGPPSPEPLSSNGGGESPERVFYEATVRFLDVQISTNEALDNKAANIFSVASTVLPVTFGLLSLAPNRISGYSIAALIAALVAYAVLLLCAWRASTFRGLEYRPNLQKLDEYSQEYEERILIRWVATEYKESTEANEWELERKARWTGAANTALYLEGALLSLAALLALS